MDFWDVLSDARMERGFGEKRVVFSSKTSVIAYNRPDTSLYMVQPKSFELGPSQATFRKFDGIGIRYILAKDITFDALLSIYDVNSNTCIAIRPTRRFDKAETARIRRFVSNFKRPNLEMRIIGMQSTTTDLFPAIEELRGITNADAIEVDIFGGLKRHVAIDLMTGMSYDVLLQDRIYKPGELLNDVTRDAYNGRASKLDFV